MTILPETCTLAILIFIVVSLASATALNASDYGVDASFPIHRDFVVDPFETRRVFGRDKIELYRRYMDGCHEKYGRACDLNENERLALNLRQPRAMTNYTDVGFEKARLPEPLWKLLREHWEEAMNNGGIERLGEETWPKGNTYTNHW